MQAPAPAAAPNIVKIVWSKPKQQQQQQQQQQSSSSPRPVPPKQVEAAPQLIRASEDAAVLAKQGESQLQPLPAAAAHPAPQSLMI